MSNETKKIHLALQGGGAHGAFTWGVLDALLTDGRLQFAGISGTSAGALNAVAVGHGWARAQGSEAEPAEEARVALAHIWRRVMNLGAMSEGPGRLARLMLGALPGAWGRLLSIVVMLTGITLFLRLAQTLFKPHKVRFECETCGLAKHDPDAVHCKACGRVLCIPNEE